jgi:hypothetical protein
MRLSILLAFISLITFGCATPPPVVQYTPEQQQYLNEVNQFPVQFMMPKTAADDAWGRAQSFIGQYGTMKIKLVTDYIIQTYNASDPNQNDFYFAYTITKAPIDQNVQFNVNCTTGDFVSDAATTLNAHILAYYMSTAVVEPDFLKH